MRQDAQSLLERLNRQQFRYQDFTEAAEEIELWPLFQAVLRDPRVVGVRNAAELTTPAPAAAAVPDRPVAVERPSARPQPESRNSFFARYRDAEEEPIAEGRAPDLREFLGRIGEKRT